MTFSERLKEIREANDYIRRNLAAALNVTIATISNYENGKREPDIKLLIQISDYLNVSVDYLLGLTNVNLRPNDINKPYSKDISIKHLLRKLLDLNPNSRRLAVELLDCIETRQLISDRTKK